MKLVRKECTQCGAKETNQHRNRCIECGGELISITDIGI